MAGLYIIFEGPEGCGKSTQFKKTVEFLKSKKYPVFATKEPGGTDFGKTIREILLYDGAKQFKTRINSLIAEYKGNLSKRTEKFLKNALKEQKGNDLSPKVESCLFNADRSYLMDTIEKKIANGEIVLSDRNYFSTYAYQGFVGEEDIKKLDKNISQATGGLKPDLVIVYEIDPKVGLKRAKKATANGKKDRKESKPLSYHQKLAKAYKSVIKREREKGQSVAVIEVDKLGINQVFEETKEILMPFIELNYEKNKNN